MAEEAGAWVLVGPGRSLEQLSGLVELRAGQRKVRVIERDSVPGPSEWPDLVPSGAAGVLLVGDRRRSPRRVTAWPFVPDRGGAWVPVGWVPAVPDLSPFVAAATRVSTRVHPAPVAVLGQRSPRYQRLGARLVHHLGEVGSVRWGAERLTREDLVDGLAAGLGTAVYLGHGRPAGWAAYRGLRAEHLRPLVAEPVGCILSVTCWTASRRRVGISFCEKIVTQGSAASAVGAVLPVLHLDNTRVVVALACALREGAADVAALMRGIFLEDGHPTPEAAGFRLCGDPLAVLAGCEETSGRTARVFAPPPDYQPAWQPVAS